MENEKRLIDANALMDKFRAYMVDRYYRKKCVSEENCKTCENSCLWRKMVSVAPTVDAVEVVRCEDCKMAVVAIPPLVAEQKLVCTKSVNWRAVEPDHFCSYGERKDNERKAD